MDGAERLLMLLASEYYEDAHRASPTWATALGDHRYDSLLDDLSPDAVRLRITRAREYLARLRAIDRGGLNVHDDVNWQLLESSILVSLHDDEVRQVWRRDPGAYVDWPISAIALQITRDYAPLDDRLEAVRARLSGLPAYLEIARRNLDCPPRVFTEVAIETTEGAITFLSDSIDEVSRLASPSVAGALLEARDVALAAVRSYLDWLATELLPRSSGDFALGRDAFSERLRIEHQIDQSIEEIAETGRREFDRAMRLLVELAAEIDPESTWERIVENARRSHPTADGLLAAYRLEIAKMKAFVVDRRLATLSAGEQLDVVETPFFARSTTPYGAYMPPAPFDAEQRGEFWVTPVDPALDETEREELLGEHCWAALPSTALHEAYPGHHLQLARANAIDDVVRQHSDSSLFAEGWALYCEQLMGEQGYIPVGLVDGDPRVFRLLLLKDQLWRAARILIDVGLHTGGMTIEQAVALLTDEVRLVEAMARVEVSRYTLTPTQPLSYMLGKLEILRLRGELSHLPLGEFHDRLLSLGTIPLKLVRTELFGTK